MLEMKIIERAFKKKVRIDMGDFNMIAGQFGLTRKEAKSILNIYIRRGKIRKHRRTLELI